jgi:hypothetical protein
MWVIRCGFSGNSIERSYWHIPDLSVGQGIEKVTSWSVAKHIHRGGDLGKSSFGSRAKAAARRIFKAKRSGSSIIPGASGFPTQNVYRIYQESRRLTAKFEKGVPNFNDGVPPRIAPSVSPNRQSRIKSQPFHIKSEY